MEFHINRSIRERLELDEVLFSYTGNVVFGNIGASRRLAAQLNELRSGGPKAANVVNAGTLFAMGLIDELSHAMAARYRAEVDPHVLTDALTWFAAKVGKERLDALLLAFTEQFPHTALLRGEHTAAEWLAGTTAGLPNREAAFEELMMLWLANANPGFADFQELFGDESLNNQTAYKSVVQSLPAYFKERPAARPDGRTLLEVLREPALASPTSITAQLDFIRENWADYLDDNLRQILLAIDVIREEDIAIWMRFHPGTGGMSGHGELGWQAQGFVGDEYVGFEESGDYVVGPDGVRRRREYSSDHQAPLNEYEAFSADHAWMPTVVMMAKSTYVWLEQLSQKYLRHIHRLDQIPDEELALLAKRGMTALWLIGLWERSVASQTIKRLRGNPDAVASAYSLKEYDIADDLGGKAAYEYLRDRAAAHGLRLASDMVPNHMGIDSNWVIDHPEWFVSRNESPFPSYSFNGPDLATGTHVEIKIDDHYYDQTDAAVAFRVRDHRNNVTQFLYHGNDGTTFAWNDTAQLDYSKASVREHVMQVILHVARLFPIIRFDAAMVLAKRHVQRLWFPLPGVGGSIPSRAENAMSQEEFDALMPNEFWREVVDRVAAEVPGTLLLAEAFWLLEGYFVRTLGMHRVYNSAFMNMLRDEENAKYRSYLKKTIEFDPDILKRYVNFMSNPDERTAADQFGDGDKYFGTCTLLATLPGLPMFAHGQIEGFTERYGMDFKQARMREQPNQGMVDRYQREITPLLKSRHLFAESTHFVLYDFWNEHGTVDENVLAYSNRSGDERAVIIYNNVYQGTRGTIHISAASMDKGSGVLGQRSLTDALGLWPEDGKFVAYRDPVRNLEYLRRSMDLQREGLSLDLQGYQYVILRHWRELRPTEEQPWDKLHDALHGEGVQSLDLALTKLRFRPVHEALRHVLGMSNLQAFDNISRELAHDVQATKPVVEVAKPGASIKPAVDKSQVKAAEQGKLPTSADIGVVSSQASAFFREALNYLPHADHKQPSTDMHSKVDPVVPYAESFDKLAQAMVRLSLLPEGLFKRWPAAVRDILPGSDVQGKSPNGWAPMLAWALLASFPAPHNPLAAFDELDLRSALAELFSALGFEGEDAWRAAARVRVLLSNSNCSVSQTVVSNKFWGDADVRWLAGLSDASGITYFNKECFEELLTWLQLPDLLKLSAGSVDSAAWSELEARMENATSTAENSGYQLSEFRKQMLEVETRKAAPLVDVGATELDRVANTEALAMSAHKTATASEKNLK